MRTDVQILHMDGAPFAVRVFPAFRVLTENPWNIGMSGDPDPPASSLLPPGVKTPLYEGGKDDEEKDRNGDSGGGPCRGIGPPDDGNVRIRGKGRQNGTRLFDPDQIQ